MKCFLFKKNSLIVGSLFPREAALYKEVPGSLCYGMMDSFSEELLAFCFLTPSYAKPYTMSMQTLTFASEENLSDSDARDFIDFILEQLKLFHFRNLDCEFLDSVRDQRVLSLFHKVGLMDTDSSLRQITTSIDQISASSLVKALLKNNDKLPKAILIDDPKSEDLQTFAKGCLHKGFLFDIESYDPDLTVFVKSPKDAIIGFARIIPTADGTIMLTDFYVEESDKFPFAPLSLLLRMIQAVEKYRGGDTILNIKISEKLFSDSYQKKLSEQIEVRKFVGLTYEIPTTEE